MAAKSKLKAGVRVKYTGNRARGIRAGDKGTCKGKVNSLGLVKVQFDRRRDGETNRVSNRAVDLV